MFEKISSENFLAIFFKQTKEILMKMYIAAREILAQNIKISKYMLPCDLLNSLEYTIMLLNAQHDTMLQKKKHISLFVERKGYNINIS